MSLSNKKMQSVNFKSIDDLLAFLPDDELEMLVFLREMIFDCAPGLSEKLSYNVPFYKGRKNILFLWPASVLWGKKISYKGLRLGFTQGVRLEDPESFLEKADRKQVFYKTYQTLEAIQEDTERLKAFIFEAILIDQNR